MFDIDKKWQLLKKLCDQFSALESMKFDELFMEEIEKIINLKTGLEQIKNLVVFLSAYLDELAQKNKKEGKLAKTGFPSDSIAIYVPIGRRLIEYWKKVLSDQRIEELKNQRHRQ